MTKRWWRFPEAVATTLTGALSELELGTVSIGEKVQVNSWMTGASAEGEIVEISDYPTDNANSWSDGNSNVSYYPFKVFVSEEADLREGDYVDMSYQNSTGSADGNTCIWRACSSAPKTARAT